MYANPQRQEYEALVGRVREHYGSSVEIGGYDHNSLLRLRQLDAKREAAVAAQKEAQPLNDARAQLNREHQRAVKAWQQIGSGQARIAEHKRAHQILGFDLALLEPIPAIMAKVALGRELAAIRDRTPNNRKFGELVRTKYDLEAQAACDMMRVARAYGDREEIASRVSWRALVVLSGSLPAQTRQGLEKRILAGERVGVAQIVKAGREKPTTKARPAAKRPAGRPHSSGRNVRPTSALRQHK
jgi:hypothetical protein